MKNITKLIICLLTVLCVCFSCFPIAYASQDDMVFPMPYSRPVANDNSAYVELLWKNSDGTYWVEVLVFQFTQQTGTLDSSLQFSDISVQFNSVLGGYTSNFHIFTSDTNSSFIVLRSRLHDSYCSFDFYSSQNGYVDITTSRSPTTLAGYHLYGNFSLVDDVGYMPEFIVTYGADSSEYEQNTEIIGFLQELLLQSSTLHADNVITQEQLDSVISICQLIGKEVVAIGDDVYTIKNSCSSILKYTQEISGFIIQYLPQMSQYLMGIQNQLIYVNNHLSTIEADVSSILELLRLQSDVEITQADSSNVNNALDIENSLLDNSNVDVSDVIQVDINQNALTVIWGLVEDVLNTNGKIFGCVLTVISLGIVAMILGRKV